MTKKIIPWIGLLFILLFNGCATTNSQMIRDLENTNKKTYEFLRFAKSIVKIDKSSPRYIEWKNSVFNKNAISIPLDRIKHCNYYRKGYKNLFEYKRCLNSPYVYLDKKSLDFYHKDKNIIINMSVFSRNYYMEQTTKGKKRFKNYVTFKSGVVESEKFAEYFIHDYHSGDPDYKYRRISMHKIYNNLMNSLNEYNIKYTVLEE